MQGVPKSAECDVCGRDNWRGESIRAKCACADAMRPYVVIVLFMLEPCLIKAPPPLQLRIDCSRPKNKIHEKGRAPVEGGKEKREEDTSNRSSSRCRSPVLNIAFLHEHPSLLVRSRLHPSTAGHFYEQDPSTSFRKHHSTSGEAQESLCGLLHSAIPAIIRNGRFQLLKDSADQAGFGNEPVAISVPPPKGFIPKYGPKLKLPRVRVPKLKVPLLRPHESATTATAPAPRVGSPMRFPRVRSRSRPLLRDTGDDMSSAERMERFKKGVQKMLHVVKVLGQIDEYLSERTRIVVDKLAKTFAE